MQGRVEQGRRGRAAPPQAPAAKPTTDDLVNAFLGTVSVDQVRGSRLVNVSVTSSDPAFAARAADTLVEEYVQFNFEFRTDSTRKSLDFLASEIAKQQKKVEDSERAMAQYRETNNALSLEDRQNTVVASLNSVNEQYTRTRSERIQKEAVYNQIRNRSPSSALADSPAVNSNATVQSLRTRLAELQRTKVQLNERYGPKNPQVIENENAIVDTTKRYQEALDGRGRDDPERLRDDARAGARGSRAALERIARARRWI